MNSNKYFLVVALFLATFFGGVVATPSCFAQHRPEAQHQGLGPRDRDFNPQDFRKKVREYITREAHLTAKEADIVFPLFFEMKDKQRQLRHKIDQACQRVNNERLSERDCQRLLTQVEQMERQLADCEVNFYSKLRRRGISASKILRIRAADENFRRSTFHQATRGQHPPRR